MATVAQIESQLDAANNRVKELGDRLEGFKAQGLDGTNPTVQALFEQYQAAIRQTSGLNGQLYQNRKQEEEEKDRQKRESEAKASDEKKKLEEKTQDEAKNKTGKEADVKKPDGTSADVTGATPSTAKGTAENTTGLKEGSATVKVSGGEAAKTKTDPVKTSPLQGAGVTTYPNPLEQFASYSPLWTMACLTKQQYNDPKSYRNSPADLKHIVFSSAGRYDSQRVKTFYGTPEYFINNFTMNTAVSPTESTGNSNAIKFTFDVYEPYSMGLFLQSLQLAAINAGYANYLNNTPYVLKLDFVGYDDSGKLFKGIKSKYYTLRLTKVDFNVNESGSTYRVTAVPFNHQGFSTLNNQIFKDIAITGSTVKDLLVTGERSMCAALNEIEKQSVAAKKKTYPDIFEVQFPSSQDELLNVSNAPTTDSATVNPNAVQGKPVGSKPAENANFGINSLGESDMGFDAAAGGNYVFKKEGDVYDERTGRINRDKMSIDVNQRTFHFTQGQSVTSVIAQILLSSKFIVDSIRNVKIDKTGSFDWFRIDVQIQLLEFDTLIGDYQKKIIYRVVPFKAHVSIFGSPTSAPPGYDELEKLVVKKYQYIYSGQNNDIIRFDIQIKNLFYTGINPSAESENGVAANSDQNSPTEDVKNKTEVSEAPAGTAAIASNTGGTRTGPDPDQRGAQEGGSGHVDEAKKVAEAFNTAFLKSNTDLIAIDLEILGDPFWLVDSGIGNYFAKPNPANPLVTQDGTINYEGGHVYIYLSFRTPTDVDDAKGVYIFPDKSRESSFSGLYRVTKCENEFKDGTFTQKLRCVRMPKQSNDFDNKPQPSDPKKAIAVSITEEEKRKTTVNDKD